MHPTGSTRATRFSSVFAAWKGLLPLLLAFACTEPPRVVPSAPGDPALYGSLVSRHRYQEAAWEARKLGRPDTADSLVTLLESILSGEPLSVTPYRGTHITDTWTLAYPHDIRGFFKVEGSDPDGPIVHEIPAYRLDRLLGFDLTPLTLFRSIVTPTGDTLSGTVKYFVEDAATARELELSSADKPDKLILFDAVIGNADRHLGNWLIRMDTHEVVAIDHNRAFEHGEEWTWYRRIRSISDPSAVRPYLQRLRTVPEDSLRAVLELLPPERVTKFYAARATMLRFFDPNSPPGD